MFDAYGPLHRVDLAAWLWLVVALPLAAFILAAYLGMAAEPPERAVARQRRLLVWAVSSVAAAVLIVLGRWGHDSAQLCHLFRLVRVGRVDASFDLMLDAVSMFLGLGVAIASVGASGLAQSPASEDARERLARWGPLVTAGALIVALADGLPTTLIGGAIASAAAAMASGRFRAFYMDRVSDACLLAGTVILAWSLGGGFVAGDFMTDMNPRMIAASSTQEDAIANSAVLVGDDDDDDRPHSTRPVIKDLSAGGKGSLSILAPEGSLVFIDDVHTPVLGPDKTPLRLPLIRYPLAAGVHVVRVRPAEGTDDTLMPRVVISTERDTRLALLGPTTSLREANEEFGLKHAQTDALFRDELLAHEAWPGARMSAFVAALLALGVLLRLIAFTLDFSLIGAIAAWPMLAVSARCASIFSYEPRVASVITLAAAVLAVVVAARAALGKTFAEVLALCAIAKGLLALSAIGSGAMASGVLDAGASLVALAVLDRVSKTTSSATLAEAVVVVRRESTWSLVWVVAAFALVLSPTSITALGSALSVGGALGAITLGAMSIAMALLSYALFRPFALALIPRGKSKKRLDSAVNEARAWLAVGLAALAAGVLLGFDARLIGGDPPLAWRMTRDVIASSATTAPPSQGTLFAVGLVWIGLIAGAGSFARRRMAPVKTANELAAMDRSTPLEALARAWDYPRIALDRVAERWTTVMARGPAIEAKIEAPRGLVLAMWVLSVVTIAAIGVGWWSNS